nr:MASE3 domain-containing protein [uncultured Desulfobulbus sp.]
MASFYAPSNKQQKIITSVVLLSTFASLYATTFVNYLLFHALAEIFSIVVAFSIFVVARNSERYIRNAYLLFVGIAYLFIGFLDLLHTLSYKGMPIFTDYDYYANQLWIGARYMESLTLLVAFAFLGRKRLPRVELVFSTYLVLTALLVASIFSWKLFPVCFIEGQGLTPFKKFSEYIICIILAASLYLLQSHRANFELKIFKILFASIVCTIISELAFTFYINNYGLSNLIGHYFKIFSFLLLYVAIIKTGIEQPYELIFRELTETNQNLEAEISWRKRMQKQNEGLIISLQKALDDIQTLEGILPVCMYCKKVRDDSESGPGEGPWMRMEEFLYQKSGTALSHGCCPDCYEKLKERL